MGELTAFVIYVKHQIHRRTQVLGVITTNLQKCANTGTPAPPMPTIKHTYPQLGPKAELKHTENI